jgi:hypothetical protein
MDSGIENLGWRITIEEMKNLMKKYRFDEN